MQRHQFDTEGVDLPLREKAPGTLREEYHPAATTRPATWDVTDAAVAGCGVEYGAAGTAAAAGGAAGDTGVCTADCTTCKNGGGQSVQAEACQKGTGRKASCGVGRSVSCSAGRSVNCSAIETAGTSSSGGTC